MEGVAKKHLQKGPRMAQVRKAPQARQYAILCPRVIKLTPWDVEQGIRNFSKLPILAQRIIEFPR